MKFSFSLTCVAALVAALPLTVLAASPVKPTAKLAATAQDAATVVDLFEGMESGDIEVKVIPKDSKEGLVTIKNKTGKPLAIKIPDALAGVPVLAQFGGGGFGGDGDMGVGASGGGGQNQGFSGGGMMGAGMGGMGGQAGGFFNVGPEKVGKLKLVTVCMDHGKKDPNPRVPYKLIPIESYAKDAHVTEVVKMMVKGEIDQHSAQAAVWHLQNGLTWEELTAKIGAKHLDGSVEAYFNPLHLEQAMVAVKVGGERAAKAAKEQSQSKSIGDELASQR